MDSSKIIIDCGFFNNHIVVRAAHRYSATCYIELCTRGDHTEVILTPKVGSEQLADLRARFLNDLLDEQLRDLVRHETGALQSGLIEAALREARPRTSGEVA